LLIEQTKHYLLILIGTNDDLVIEFLQEPPFQADDLIGFNVQNLREALDEASYGLNIVYFKSRICCDTEHPSLFYEVRTYRPYARHFKSELTVQVQQIKLCSIVLLAF
jgi:hypothetical protein